MAADTAGARDPVAELRMALAQYDRLRECPDPDSRQMWVEVDDADARAILARLECAEKMAKLVAEVRAAHTGVLLPVCRCDWCASTKAVLAKWEALRG